MEILLRAIGTVHIKVTEEEVRGEKRDLEGDVEIYPEYEAALEGIVGYSHLFLICYFHKLRPEQIGPLQVKPKRLTRRGFSLDELPSLGVFSLDSPSRPNPIGLTLVRLLGREGCRLRVQGIDYFDGTPVLDIKGYRPEYRVENFSLPEWYFNLMDAEGHI